jgi:hypothetical protein
VTLTVARPDYTTLRDATAFSWSITGSQGALRDVTGTPIREFNLEPNACIEAYRKGRPILREMFGEDLALPGPATPAISYSHVNALGSELLFPEGGEVAHTHIYGSLEEGIARLREPVDYASVGWAPYFLKFRDEMREAFPGEAVGLSFGVEAPLTTAYELRGEGIFTDMMDDPELTGRFLEAVVDSMLDYCGWLASLEGGVAFNESGAGMVDDISSFVPPRLFSRIVIPAWERYYTGLTSGTRSAHVEDLRPEQLPFLEEIGLGYYDPSISPRLHPKIIRDRCRVPFVWRLESFHCWEMSLQEVADFVYQSAADGASGVTVSVAEGLCDERAVAQMGVFAQAAKETQRMLQERCSREEVGQRVSPEGREKLWEGWCGFLGPRSSRGGARAKASSPPGPLSRASQLR